MSDVLINIVKELYKEALLIEAEPNSPEDRFVQCTISACEGYLKSIDEAGKES